MNGGVYYTLITNIRIKKTQLSLINEFLDYRLKN